MDRKRVCVIGAGFSGLVAAKTFVGTDRYDVTVFEKLDKVGGVWYYDENTVDADGRPVNRPMYQNLRTNLPRELMALPDYPLTVGDRSFVTHPVFHQYLVDYASHFGLMDKIQFQITVTSVKPVAGSGSDGIFDRKWSVAVADRSGRDSNHEFDVVIVANGHHSVPIMPKLEGLDSFKGGVRHSVSYRRPDDFRGKRVVCIGAGHSGGDIAIDVIKGGADKVYLAKRAGGVLVGPGPDDIWPSIDSIMPTIPGLSVVGEIVEVTESSVRTVDGESLDVDEIMLCTGYQYRFPFLEPDCQVETTDGSCPYLWKHLIDPRFPTMAFPMLPMIAVPAMLVETQIKFFLAVLDGKVRVPTVPEDAAETEAYLAVLRGRGLPDRAYSFLGPDCFAYNAELERLGGFAPVADPVRNDMMKDVVFRASADLGYANFRECNYRVVSADEFVRTDPN